MEIDKNKQAVTIFNLRALVYQEKYMDVSMYADTLDFFCEELKPGADVLELACGPGNVSKYVLNKRPDLKWLGTDLAPNMLALAKENNPRATFELMDARKIGNLNKQVDAVLCGFCLPYLSKEEALQLIRDAAKILKPGGILYLSTMEDDYAKSEYKKGSGGDELFMYFHEAGYLKTALLESGYELLKLKRQDFPTQDGSSVTDLILIAKSK